MKNRRILPSSFRDPSGFLFYHDGVLFRQVNPAYSEEYESLMDSGLYAELVNRALLVPHEEADLGEEAPEAAYKVIRPQSVPFISYPYEWCPSQLKDAALATLTIQKLAVQHGMSLKDASAYNIQFVGNQPTLIDTLSFEKYQEGKPWIAYRQFCQHFLAPLALMSYTDVRLGGLLRLHIDGIPLDLATRLLPLRTRFNWSLLLHLHLHAKSQKRYADKPIAPSKVRGFSRLALQGLIESLARAVKRLQYRAGGTEWADYYKEVNYSPAGMAHKQELVSGMIAEVSPATVWDLGANVGKFSRLAAEQGALTIAFDVDPAAVEKHYLECKNAGHDRVLPLLTDLTNPSPSLGWHHRERMSFEQRGPADAVLALALIHHLAISNNVPLDKVAALLCSLCHWLIIEFVPKSDSQVQRLLASREDIFADYTESVFELAFGEHFGIVQRAEIAESERSLYLMRKKEVIP